MTITPCCVVAALLSLAILAAADVPSPSLVVSVGARLHEVAITLPRSRHSQHQHRSFEDFDVVEKYQFAVFEIKTSKPLGIARLRRNATLPLSSLSSVSQISDSVALYNLTDDPFSFFGLTRLICGTRLFESHPFPHSLTLLEQHDQPPRFLIPLPVSPEVPRWHSFLDIVDNLRLAPPGPNTLSFALILQFKRLRVPITAQDESNATDFSAAEPEPYHVSNMDPHLLPQCSLRFLRPTQQGFTPFGMFFELDTLKVFSETVRFSDSSFHLDSAPTGDLDESVADATDDQAVDPVRPASAGLQAAASSDWSLTDSASAAPIPASPPPSIQTENPMQQIRASIRADKALKQAKFRALLGKSTEGPVSPKVQRQREKFANETVRLLQRLRLYKKLMRLDPFSKAGFYHCGEHEQLDKSWDDPYNVNMLETDIKIKSKVRLWSYFMAKNPVKAILDGFISIMEGVLVGPIFGFFQDVLLDKLVEGTHDKVVQDLTQKMVPQVASLLPPSIQQTLPDSLFETVPQSVTDTVLGSVPNDISSSLDRSVPRMLSMRVPEQIDEDAPRMLVKQMALSLSTMLIKAIAHGVTPAMKHTLHSTADEMRCSYCAWNKDNHEGVFAEKPNSIDMCKDCPVEKIDDRALERVEHALYYAGYFSMYYTQYYAQMDFSAVDDSAQNSQYKRDFFNNWKPVGFRDSVAPD